METEEIKDRFNEFYKTYDEERKQIIWKRQSQKFRDFWENKVMNDDVKELREEEIDEIIKILDTKARGNTKEDEAVAMVMIPQGAWIRMFKEIKRDKTIKELLDKIFNSEEKGTFESVSQLYKVNENRKNWLTGKSANAINTMNFAFNPTHYLSMVSLNDRKKIIDFFEIPNGPDFEKDSMDTQIFLSNNVIILWFQKILGRPLWPRTICDFLYISLKTYWKEIPDYQSIMLPLLEFAGDQKEYRFRDSIEYISNFFELSESQRRERLPSGFDRIIDNRVGWAKTYLKKAGLLEDPRRGYFKITDKGLEILNQNPSKINIKFLMKFPEFVEFQTPRKEKLISEEGEETKTPRELIEEGYKKINENLAQDLLTNLRTSSSDFLEDVGAKLLEKMGYGKGEVIGGPGDGGIDGKIYQDELGLDMIFIQCKRYQESSVVGTTDIDKFIAALDVNKATKGVFIATSNFHKNALDRIKESTKNIIPISGEKLVELMIRFNLGISIGENYPIKELDTDFFKEDKL